MASLGRNFGFGCMRLPTNGESVNLEETGRMVDAFLEAGFNYFDTAHGYLQSESEKALKVCLTSRYPRESYVLTDKLENLPLGKQKVSSDTHTVGYVFLWFVIPLLLVLGVDVLVVRRRERKNAKRKQQEEEMKSKELKTENPKIEEQE